MITMVGGGGDSAPLTSSKGDLGLLIPPVFLKWRSVSMVAMIQTEHGNRCANGDGDGDDDDYGGRINKMVREAWQKCEMMILCAGELAMGSSMER